MLDIFEHSASKTMIIFIMRPSCYNHGHNILEICKILEIFGFTTSKVVVDIKHKKHCIGLPYKLPNDNG